jgi:hypothetical protein
MKRFKSRLTYANVISTLCLFLVLGGGAYAATRLPKNSVGTKQLKNGAVSPAKLNAAAKKTITGPAGPAGPPGAPGATHVLVRVAPEFTEGRSEVFCNPGEVATGGGGYTQTSEELLWGTFPAKPGGEQALAGEVPKGWAAGGETAAGVEVPVKAYVICASP